MASSQPGSVSSIGTAVGLTTVGPSLWAVRPLTATTVQVLLTGTGQVDTVVNVEVSNGPSAAPVPTDTPAGVISLSNAAGKASDGFSITLPWRYVRFKVISLTGTGAAVSGLLGA